MNMLSGYELGWIVAFLEGEGSFAFSTDQKKPNTGHLCVSANQVQREPLERLQRYSGLGEIRGPYGPYGAAHQKRSPQYRWRLYGNVDTRQFMELLRPHMSPRRQMQIDRAISRYERRTVRDHSAVTAKRNRTVADRTKNDPRQLRIVG